MVSPNPTLLLEQLELVLEKPEAFGGSSHELIKLARKAAVMLEGPFETFQRLVYSPLPIVATRIAQDRKIFETLVENKTRLTSATTLAEKSKIKPKVLESLLDYMTTQLMVEEVSPGQYKATKVSEMLLAPIFINGATHFHDAILPAFTALHASLSSDRTAFLIGHNTDLDCYSWIEQRPALKKAFHGFMEVQLAGLPDFLTVFPLDEFVGSSTPEKPIFVDIGGGIGHQAELVRKKFPDLQGRVVLQDRPDVLAKAGVGDHIEKMTYDYLTPQPVRGARVYYFRQILHNNDDETCLRILKAQIDAMDVERCIFSEYSSYYFGPPKNYIGSKEHAPDPVNLVIVIDEKVLVDVKPEGGVEEYTTALSLCMLAVFNALERKEGQWRELLAKAGLEIREIKKFTEHGDAVIVAGKKR